MISIKVCQILIPNSLDMDSLDNEEDMDQQATYASWKNNNAQLKQ
jgi:hypothetical protein